jgi:hypothetical protein
MLGKKPISSKREVTRSKSKVEGDYSNQYGSRPGGTSKTKTVRKGNVVKTKTVIKREGKPREVVKKKTYEGAGNSSNKPNSVTKTTRKVGLGGKGVERNVSVRKIDSRGRDVPRNAYYGGSNSAANTSYKSEVKNLKK